MNKSKVINIITKYVNNEATNDELDALELLLKDKENVKIFEEYVTLNHYVNTKFKKFDALKAYQKSLKNDQKKRGYYQYAIACSIAVIISLSVFFYQKSVISNDKNTQQTVNNKIVQGTDKAVLTLADGSEVKLEKGKNYVSSSVKSNGVDITYSKNGKNIGYNYLTTPRGGQFHVCLSDGTEVWLNSDSRIKYPISFFSGESRKVELLYGEAYFKVSSSKNHKGASFSVLSDKQRVNVLGTQFNIKAYKEEREVFTTLVEGKVEVGNDIEKVILKPGQQAIIDEAEKYRIVEVDVYNEVSWYKGVFSFKGKSLGEIMKVLSRWYDMDYEFKNKSLKEEKFVGVLSKKQSIEAILNSIKDTGYINNYQIIEKKVIIE